MPPTRRWACRTMASTCQPFDGGRSSLGHALQQSWASSELQREDDSLLGVSEALTKEVHTSAVLCVGPNAETYLHKGVLAKIEFIDTYVRNLLAIDRGSLCIGGPCGDETELRVVLWPPVRG